MSIYTEVGHVSLLLCGATAFAAMRMFSMGKGDDYLFLLPTAGTLFMVSCMCYIVAGRSKRAFMDDDDESVATVEDPAEDALANCAVVKTFAGHNCPICREPIVEDICVTPCAHHYHTACLYEWFKRRTVCPLCLAPVSGLLQP